MHWYFQCSPWYFRLSVSPAVESQLKSLSKRFRDRTASFRKQALEPTTPEASDDEGEIDPNKGK